MAIPPWLSTVLLPHSDNSDASRFLLFSPLTHNSCGSVHILTASVRVLERWRVKPGSRL